MNKLNPTPNFLNQMFRKDLLFMGGKVALVVGSLLTVVNHTGCCLNEQLFIRHPFQILLCFLIPFMVSMFVGARRTPATQDGHNDNKLNT